MNTIDEQTMNPSFHQPQLAEVTTPTTPTQDTLTHKKALEWELSLDKCDLRSHAWYYGSITRQYADELIHKDGDFLVRDCVSQPGNYVLTCMAKGALLHFVINKVLIQADTVYEKIQYQFEDDAYDTVPDLITYYVGSGKSISIASGARIRYPCNRNYPLSFYMAKYNNMHQMHANGSIGSCGVSPLNTPSLIKMDFSPRSSPPLYSKRDVPPKFPIKKQRSQSLTPIQPGKAMTVCSVQRFRNEKYCSADGVVLARHIIAPKSFEKHASLDEESDTHRRIEYTNENSSNSLNQLHQGSLDNGLSYRHSTQSLPRAATNADFQAPEQVTRTSSLTRNGLAILQSKAIILKDLPLDIRPQVNRFVTYHASGSDSGNGSGDSVQSPAANEFDGLQHHQQRGVVIRTPHFLNNSMSSITLKNAADVDYSALESNLMAMELNEIEQPTQFDMENYTTLLLPTIENQPLDKEALTTFRMILNETAPKLIANCLSRIDIKLILNNIGVGNSTNTGNGGQDIFACSGIELLTLSHGKQFRVDLIERTECIRLMVAVTILTCVDDMERADTLDKWIHIANDTKTALGNLYGFGNIMMGLCMPQIEKLETTWYILRQKFTDSAFNFEAKLRPQWKNMINCTNPLAPNTTIPHILSYILLRDRAITDIFDPNQTETASQLFTLCISQSEMNTADFGLSIAFAHLDSIRNFNNNMSMYRRNAQIVLSDSCGDRIDELLVDSFRTEFHMKFLWGSKGAMVSPNERYTKFDDILTLMARRYCSDTDQMINGNAKST